MLICGFLNIFATKPPIAVLFATINYEVVETMQEQRNLPTRMSTTTEKHPGAGGQTIKKKRKAKPAEGAFLFCWLNFGSVFALGLCSLYTTKHGGHEGAFSTLNMQKLGMSNEIEKQRLKTIAHPK